MEIAKIVLEYIKATIWPASVITILLVYRNELFALLARTRRINLPGGISVETFDEQLERAKELGQQVKKDSVHRQKRDDHEKKLKRPSAEPKYSAANKRMLELGLSPSPSGLEIDFYKDLAEKDPRLALAGLRLDLELMLNNLAKGFAIDIGEKESIRAKTMKLLQADAIDQRQFDFMQTILNLSNSAIHGIDVSKNQANEIIDLGQILIDDYIAWLKWGFQ